MYQIVPRKRDLGPILDRFPGPVLFRAPDSYVLLFIVIILIPFAMVLFAKLTQGSIAALVPLLLVVCAILLILRNAKPNPNWIELQRDGFTLCRRGKELRYEWREIDYFECYDFRGPVFFGSNQRADARGKNYTLWIRFGFMPQDLRDLLILWREKALSDDPSAG